MAKKQSAKELAQSVKTGKRGGLIGGKALTIKLTEEERIKKAARRQLTSDTPRTAASQ